METHPIIISFYCFLLKFIIKCEGINDQMHFFLTINAYELRCNNQNGQLPYNGRL